MPTAQPVIIAGAGPSGLTAALFLARQGIAVTVLERETVVFEDPRAGTLHPPTLDMFEASGVTRRLHELGIISPIFHFRDRRHGVIGEFELARLKGETNYPYRLQCEQHKVVRILLDELARLPNAVVRFGMPVVDIEQDADGVTVIAGPEDARERLRASYLIGADGGRSVVRKSQNIAFEGFTWEERFIVIATTFDFARDGYAFTCYISDPEEWAALFKVPGHGPPGLWRIVFPVPVEAAEAELLSEPHARGMVQRFLLRDEPFEIDFINLYQVHQRVAETFRKGRVLLVGDAAHVNNPLGGMGMNFGIHDAVNLAGKLGMVLRGDAAEALLDRYDRQRRHVSKSFLQAVTIQNKKILEERDPAVRARNHDEIRRTAADPERARAYMMQTSMINGVRAAAAIE